MNNSFNSTKVITGVNTRWSYCNVWEPKSINGGTPKYSVSLIIPKSDTTTVEKLLSAIENNKIVKPAFYKNPNNEILTLTRFVIGFNKEKIFDFYKITNSEVGFIEFTISSDNTLTKNEKSIYWSEIIEETNSLKMEIFSFEGDGTTKVFTYTLSTMPGKLPIVNLYKPNSDGSASIIQENINFNFNDKTITITLNAPLEEGGLIGGSVLYDTSQSSTPIQNR